MTGPGDTAGEAGGEQHQVQTRQLAPVAAISAASTIWLAAIGLVTTPYMLHRLGTSAYAIFALVTIVSGYLSNLEFGFGLATLRELARAHAAGEKETEAKIVGTSMSVFGLASATGAVIAFAFAPVIATKFASFPANLRGQAVDSIRVGSLLILLAFVYSFLSVSLQALGQFRPLLTTRIISGTLLSGGAVAMAAIFDDVRAVLLVQVAIVTVGCAYLLARLGRATAVRLRPSFDRPTFRTMGAYGGLTFAISVAYQAMLQGPPTVLAGIAPAAQLTAYAVPAVVLQQMTLLATSASTAFFPFASAESAHDDRSRLRRVFRSNLRITLIVMGPISGFLIVFAHTLLAAWIGDSFAAAAGDPLRLLAAAGLLISLGTPAADVARALSRLRWVLAYVVTAALVAIGSALVLADRSGAKGAATALLLGLLVATLPFIVAAPKHLLAEAPSDLLRSLARPVGATVAACALYRAGLALTPGLAGAVITGAIVTTVYAVAVYLVVLDEGERLMLRSGLRRSRASAPPVATEA